MHLTSATILIYLKKGTKIGICDYNTEVGKFRRDSKKIGKVALNAKKVFYDGMIYDSLKIFASVVGKSQSVVGRWITGKDIPRDEENRIYLTAHYATKEEIEKYPRYEINE